MLDSDIVVCSFKYTAQSTDSFSCTDRYGTTAKATPALDTTDDVTDDSTTTSYDSDTETVELTAVFYRELNTGDTTYDIILTDGDTIDAIWAHGQIISNTIQSHSSTSTKRGDFRMAIPTLADKANTLYS